MAKELLTRNEVPEHLTWDLTTIFESDEAWEAELKEVEKLSEQAENYKGKVAENAESLYNTLQYSDRLFERLNKRRKLELPKLLEKDYNHLRITY